MPELAPTLRDAGLDRVNISADTLRPDRIAAIARRDLGFDPVRAALAARAAGLAPIKLNVVVMRGINDDEIVDFARLTLDHPWHVRFIELMPVGEMRDADVGARGAERRGARAHRRTLGAAASRRGPGARQRAGGVLRASPARRARSA